MEPFRSLTKTPTNTHSNRTVHTLPLFPVYSYLIKIFWAEHLEPFGSSINKKDKKKHFYHTYTVTVHTGTALVFPVYSYLYGI
jgi:hypothetical protein